MNPAQRVSTVAVPLVLGLVGAILIVAGTRLAWYAVGYGDRDGRDIASGMEFGDLLVWLAVAIAGMAVGSVFQRGFAAGGLVICGLVLAIAWIQLARASDGYALESFSVSIDPIDGTWMLVGGGVLAAAGFVWGLVRR